MSPRADSAMLAVEISGAFPGLLPANAFGAAPESQEGPLFNVFNAKVILFFQLIHTKVPTLNCTKEC